MGLGGLDIALSGLRVAQQQLNVIANNVSNVNTEGYTRKILPQETITVGGNASGAVTSTLLRNVDLNLERDLWTHLAFIDRGNAIALRGFALGAFLWNLLRRFPRDRSAQITTGDQNLAPFISPLISR